MNDTTCLNPYHDKGLSRLKLFWALSRTPHGLLDMAAPAFAALLWLGRFPSPGVTLLGLITAFAGYTAVYALNDVIDYRSDREKLQKGGLTESDQCMDIDAVFVRHPLAHGFLSFREGLLWALAWALVALIGAYILNPVCVLIFMVGCVLEAVYCFLLKISYLRTVVNGVVKTAGGIAAVFAVDTDPSFLYLIILFLLLFFWEIGGQNIPNDWTDIEEDRRLDAQTIPVRFGAERSIVIILGSLIFAIVMNVVVFQISLTRFEIPYVLASLTIGVYLLFFPALRLFKTKKRPQAMALFTKASYYPLALLAVVVTKLIM